MVRHTNTVDFTSLTMWLEHKCSFDNKCLEALSFLDHLLRQTPSQRYVQIKRSFFAHGGTRYLLGGGVEAWKGVYASIRPVFNGRPGLAVNVDVANGTFWQESDLPRVAQQLANISDQGRIGNDFHNSPHTRRKLMQALNKLKKVAITVTHRNRESKPARFVIKRVLEVDSKEYQFPLYQTDEKTGERTQTQMISIFQYFWEKYQIVLQFANIPVLETTKGDVYPMEVCRIAPDQRYVFKLDDRQTATMIKFAVTPPVERWAAVQHGIKMLDWPEDKFMRNYGGS